MGRARINKIIPAFIYVKVLKVFERFPCVFIEKKQNFNNFYIYFLKDHNTTHLPQEKGQVCRAWIFLILLSLNSRWGKCVKEHIFYYTLAFVEIEKIKTPIFDKLLFELT